MRSWQTTKQMTSELNKPWNFFFLQLKRRTISGPPKTFFFPKMGESLSVKSKYLDKNPMLFGMFFLWGYMAILQSISKPKNIKNQCFKILSNSEKECFLLFFVFFSKCQEGAFDAETLKADHQFRWWLGRRLMPTAGPQDIALIAGGMGPTERASNKNTGGGEKRGFWNTVETKEWGLWEVKHKGCQVPLRVYLEDIPRLVSGW